MMRLMSDLIAHLRDLLVSKVEPDALAAETAAGAAVVAWRGGGR